MTITHYDLPIEQDTLPLTVARATGLGAAIVIMPSAFGIGSDLEAQMEELAQDASLVVGLDPFFRGDAGPAPYDEVTRVMKRLQAIDRERTYRDLRAAIEWAAHKRTVSRSSPRHLLCRRCGADYQIPCDRGCNPPRKTVQGFCHLCGSEKHAPCDVGGCNPGLVVQNGECTIPDSPEPSCAAPGQQCVPNRQPGTHCCGQQLCVYGYCKPCLQHGDECVGGGTQLCCDPSDSCVLDQSSETVQCGIPG